MRTASCHHVIFYCFVFLVSALQSNIALAHSSNSASLPSKSTSTLKYDPSGSSAWYPYYIENENFPGIIPEALEAIFLIANIEGQKKIFPPKRTNLALKTGEIDFDLVNVDWLPASEPLEHYVFSDGIIRIKEFVATLKDYQGPEIRSAVNNMGTVRGYYYHNEEEFNRVDFSSERELILALKLGRVGQVIIGDRPALFWAQQLEVSIQFTLMHSDGFLRMRLRKEFQPLLPRLNHAIKQINDSGKINEIVERYIKSPPIGVVIL